MAFLDDGGILITERPGRLKVLRDGKLTEIEGLPSVVSGGQGGLLDVAIGPDDGWVYLTYSSRLQGGTGTAVARARLAGTRLVDLEEIFRMDRGGRTTRHFGSRMVFDRDGTLLFTIGDRGEMNRAQDLGDHAGKTLRINTDGSIPVDNPFRDTRGALPEIYTYGNRNAQGMTIDPATGVIWQHEHGPRGGDEVNIVRSGLNYGWPVITYGIDYSGATLGIGSAGEGMEQPEVYWDPSIAPSGMTVYRGTAFPEWEGDLFVGALRGQHLRRLEVEDGRIVGQEVLLQNRVGRIRDVRTGPDGSLWILIDSTQGSLYRLVPAG
jgi:glucose/arabinose dehydrogenase